MQLFAVILVFVAQLALAAPQLCERAVAYFSPLDGGGSMLDVAGTNVGEPLNVSLSDRLLSSGS